MREYIDRARHILYNQSFIEVIRKGSKFTPRYIRHNLGKSGFYRSQYYRDILLWLNSRSQPTPNPFTIIYVDPNKITYVTSRGPNPGRFQWQDLGKIQAGNWDQSNLRVDDLPVTQALKQRFENKREWHNIEFIQYVLKQVDQGIVRWRGCRTEADVMDACAEIDALYEQIKIDGYRSKKELVEAGACSPDIWDGDGFNQYDEVLVDISRDGQFLFVDGRHRLTIAKILEIDKIPVRVSARHAAWQELREEIAETEPSALPEHLKQYLEHPDISAS